MSTLHVHVDESGDLDFSRKGSRFLVFAAMWTYNPLPLAWNLQNLRFLLLKSSSLQEYAQYRFEKLERFHCCDDNYEVRKVVIDAMLKAPDWKFAAIVVEKNKVAPTYREHLGSLYARFASMPLRLLFRGPVKEQAKKVLVYTDRFPSQCKRDLTEKAIKKSCSSELPHDLPFAVFHHASSSNAWLQAVDYCAHAIARKWEHQDRRFYDRLRSRLAKDEMNVLSGGTQTYY